MGQCVQDTAWMHNSLVPYGLLFVVAKSRAWNQMRMLISGWMDGRMDALMDGWMPTSHTSIHVDQP